MPAFRRMLIWYAGEQIFDSDDRMVLELEQKTQGTISLEAKYDSLFRACVTSRDGHYPMTIAFDLELAGTLAESDVVRKGANSQAARQCGKAALSGLAAEHVALLEAAVLKLQDGLQLIAKEQEYIKIRESAHRDCTALYKSCAE